MARESWSNKLIYISTVAGATIGFGATWRFPYLVGENGGGAYLLVFFIAMLILGVPMLVAEHLIGRRLHTNVVDAFSGEGLDHPISKLWKGVGVIAILGAFGILAYYMVLGGWVMSYIGGISLGEIDLSTPLSAETTKNFFEASTSSPWKMTLYTFIFVAVNYYILVKGIIDGIERVIRWVMPLFLLLVFALMIRALFLPGAMEGVKFYIIPDFSKINSQVILLALGQVFFALSIGFGVMVTLSSYLSKKENIASISVSAGIINTMIPLAIGFIIFPALFSAGIEPASGPSLVFQVLPAVFSTIPFGAFFAVLFFLLLLLAALTTSITIYEVAITTLIEKFKMTRPVATFLTLAVIFIFGNVPSILADSIWSDIHIFGMNFFDAFDYISANILFITTSLLSAIFIGFILKKKVSLDEMTNNGEINQKIAPLLFYHIKFVIPALILIIFGFSFI
ncbi:sodium-dependent transporter [Ignatzschineria rhizosphaerae]|uniref:Transporter n=1 Tax=Ignatzschineria rhizosphaerae TaxID=2923279 RepID=A0ABY3X2L7_9GAMM|nr:sodium-dependent transporter [Ignatzschineria rhizosphaerae]UNM95702.1 sodium-dependent transporter [Ignatzschineria rhizosphaerae]